MKISVVGTGYVGLVTGACLADAGNDVLCLDLDESKIKILKDGGIPIHEPGLLDIVRKNVAAGRLRFTTSVEESVAFGLVQFIAVGTPPDEDGSADLKYVLAAARNIGRHMTSEKVVVDKSTVPVGTADKVRAAIADELAQRKSDLPFHVVSNPEFLKEGAAVEDFQRPDRIVVGVDSARAIDVMRQIYAPFQRNHDKLMVMDVRSAELTKYAANAMLATRISFMNELANLAETLGADIEQVRMGIGSDSRIGYSFLYAGCGYGGSCFPKDVKALIKTASENGHTLQVLTAVEDANEAQKSVLVNKITTAFGKDLKGKRFALWGLAFKPNTDDMREAPSRVIIDALLARGATVCAYDPVAIDEAKRVLGASIDYANRAVDAIEGADALVIVTEWKEFRSPSFDLLAEKLKTKRIFDGRNLYDPAMPAQYGIIYEAIGRKI
ncbi:nucleotide sugar dehydrogenase [Betaproteobacteria bacterium LSUCC0115]|nr:nucleotide sugar dehydrogenase [Burkholderiales bacterium LSUCC0115]